MTNGDLDKVLKNKEKTLVQHDCMKLEIKKLRDTVNTEADRVYGLENRKYQLEMSMEEREKEIQVHKDILVSELKAAEEERHKVAVELQLRKNKVKNLRIKYEGLVQKSQSSSGEVEAVGEHSQAYYVIKAAQEKEELQRYGDELDGKIRKCEKEIKALANTLDHLKMSKRTTMRMHADSWRLRQDSSSCTSKLKSKTTRGIALRRRLMINLRRLIALKSHCRASLTMSLLSRVKSLRTPKRTSKSSLKLNNSRTDISSGHFNSSFRSSLISLRS